MFSNIQDAVPDGCEDAYTAPRAMLIAMTSEAFPLLSEALVKKVAENLLFQSICRLRPDEMDEQWARESVGDLLGQYQRQTLAGETPRYEYRETIRNFLYLISEAEIEADNMLSKARRHMHEYSDVIREYQGYVAEAQKIMSVCSRNGKKYRRYARQLENAQRYIAEGPERMKEYQAMLEKAQRILEEERAKRVALVAQQSGGEKCV
jgi:hypothetical protein